MDIIPSEACHIVFLCQIITIRPAENDFENKKHITDIKAELKQALGILIDYREDRNGVLFPNLALLAHPRTYRFILMVHITSPVATNWFVQSRH